MPTPLGAPSALGEDELEPMPAPLGEDVSPEARAAYERGRAAVREGRLADAVGQFHLAAQIEPRLRQAHLELGKTLQKIGQPRLAAQAFSKALAAGERTAPLGDVYFARAKAYLDAGEHAKALADLDAAVQSSPANADYLYQQGKALIKMASQEFAEGLPSAADTLARAIAALDRAIENRSGHAEALADRGQAKAELGQADEAIADLAAAVELRPDDALFQYRLGLAHLRRAARISAADDEAAAERRDDLAAAVASLSSVLEMVSEDSDEIKLNDARLTRAVAQMEWAALLGPDDRSALYESSLADCDAVIAANRNSAAAHFHRGAALRMLGRLREAIDAWTQSLRLAPENSEARLRRGIAWFHLDEYDLAASDFRAVGLLPGDPRPDFWLGVIHARRGDHLEAIRSFTAALQQNRRYRLAYANRALSYMHLGSWQRASEDLNEMIQLDPHDAAAYYRRGLVQQRLGRREEARRSWQKVLQIQPDHANARSQLARTGSR